MRNIREQKRGLSVHGSTKLCRIVIDFIRERAPAIKKRVYTCISARDASRYTCYADSQPI